MTANLDTKFISEPTDVYENDATEIQDNFGGGNQDDYEKLPKLLRDILARDNRAVKYEFKRYGFRNIRFDHGTQLFENVIWLFKVTETIEGDTTPKFFIKYTCKIVRDIDTTIIGVPPNEERSGPSIIIDLNNSTRSPIHTDKTRNLNWSCEEVQPKVIEFKLNEALYLHTAGARLGFARFTSYLCNK